MFAILGHLAGALGLFFMGARLLTEHLKMLTNRQLRLSAVRWTSGRLRGFVWGLVAGAIMQSTTVLTILIVSLLKSDMLSPKRAFPILLGCNVGGALLVLIVMLDIKLIALYILGIAQVITMVMGRDRAFQYRAMGTACFGLALIVLGSIMLRESVVPLTAYPWFQQTMEWVGDSLLLPLVIGALLTLVTQSSGLIMVTGIGMAAAGLFTIEQVLTLYCGACLGSSLCLYLLTLTFTGRARQVAMYQVLHNGVVNAIFVPLICVEAYFDVPLAAAAVRASGLPLSQALAVFVICSEAITSVFQLVTLGLAVRYIERWWPPTEVEVLAKPQFIHDYALDDATTALRLVDREQRCLLKTLSRYLDAVRRRADVGELREAARAVLVRLDEFLSDLAAYCVDLEMDEHNSMMTRQKLFTWLEQQVAELCDVLPTLPPHRALDTWSQALVEGIDVVLLVLLDTLESDDAAAWWPSTTQLTRDRARELRKLRDLSLKNESTLTPNERKKVLQLVSITEHVFLLLSQLAHEYRQDSKVDELFLEHADEALSMAHLTHMEVLTAAQD